MERYKRGFRDASSCIEDLVLVVSLRIAKQVLVRKEFMNINMNDILFKLGCLYRV